MLPVLCGLTGLPVLIVLVPAKQSENGASRAGDPQLAKLKREGLIQPLTLAADAGFRGNDVYKALLDIGIDPRIDLVDRKERWIDDEIQGGPVRISLLVRGHIARRVGHRRVAKDRSGKPLAQPKLVPVYQLLPVKRIDPPRYRVGYGCAPAPIKLLTVVSPHEREAARRLWACGADHVTETCRAGADGVLYWTTVTGRPFETTVVTRARPAGARHFRGHELLAITNMVRLRVRDRLNGVPVWLHEARLRLIAGYLVRRRRKRRKRAKPPDVQPPLSRAA